LLEAGLALRVAVLVVLVVAAEGMVPELVVRHMLQAELGGRAKASGLRPVGGVALPARRVQERVRPA